MWKRVLGVCAAGMVLAAPALADEPAVKTEQPVVQTELGAQVEQFLNEPVTVSGMAMAMSPGDIFTWVFVGVLAGTLAAMMFTRRESGFGHMANLGVGLFGALIGGFVLSVLPFRLDMGALVIGVNELIAAFAGSIVLLVFTMWLSAAQKGRGQQAQGEHGKKQKGEDKQKRRAA